MPELKGVANFIDYVAVEPDPIARAALKRSLEAQRCRSAVVAETAIGLAEGMATLYLTGDRAGSSLLRPTLRVYEEFGFSPAAVVEDEVRVPVSRLDRVLDDHGVSDVDAMKIDTQGTELDVLASLGTLRLSSGLEENPFLIKLLEEASGKKVDGHILEGPLDRVAS